MKPSKYTEERISGILKERQGGMAVCETKRSRQLEEENTRLKRMVAELSLDKQMLEDVLSKKW